MLNDLNKMFKHILKGSRFENHTFFVGGSVRDKILGRIPNDVDIVVELENGAHDLAEYVYSFFQNMLNKELLDSLITSPYQLGHYPIYSITFKDNVTFAGQFLRLNNVTIEIAESMTEQFDDSNSRQRNVMFSSLSDDIMRRDFTINSGLIDVITMEFKDLTTDKSIINDIEKGIIRCNSSDIEYIDMILSTDPLRILRGLVFATRFNFIIDPVVLARMRVNIDRLSIVSRERINDEVKKAFEVIGGVYKLVTLLDQIGGLDIVFPKISNLKNIYQVNVNEDGTFTYDIRNIHMEGKTVFDHTLAVLKFAKSGYVNGLAALYHDVGKIYPEYKNGKVRFINHEFIGAKIVRDLFPEMKIDSETTKIARFLISNHMKLHMMHDLSKKSIRRFIREIGSDSNRFALYDLCKADCLGTVQLKDGILCSTTPHYDAMELIEQLIIEDSIDVEKPFRYFDGNEIMEILQVSGKPVGDAIRIMFQIQDEYGFSEDIEVIKNELIYRFFKKYPQLKKRKK